MPKRVGVLLVPLQTPLVTEDPKRQTVLGSGCRAGDPHRAARSVFEAYQQAGVVVDDPAGYIGAHIRHDRGDIEPGHVPSQVMTVAPNVTEHERRANHIGVGTPSQLFMITIRFGWQETLDVLDLGLPNLADNAVPYHGTGLADHWIRAVVVSQAEHEACIAHLLDKLLSVLE